LGFSQVNNKTQGLFIASTLAPRKHFFDFRALIDDLPTRALPAYQRTCLARKVAFGEDVVRDVSQALALKVRQVKADTLGSGILMPGVHVFVVHPNGKWDIRDDEVECSFRSATSTADKQVLDGAACLETDGSAVLPPDDRAPLGVHESLLEDVIEDVLEVIQVCPVADIDELGSDLLVGARRLMVGDPELRSAVSWSTRSAVGWSDRSAVG